jgi:hypothetical protein
MQTSELHRWSGTLGGRHTRPRCHSAKKNIQFDPYGGELANLHPPSF